MTLDEIDLHYDDLKADESRLTQRLYELDKEKATVLNQLHAIWDVQSKLVNAAAPKVSTGN